MDNTNLFVLDYILNIINCSRMRCDCILKSFSKYDLIIRYSQIEPKTILSLFLSSYNLNNCDDNIKFLFKYVREKCPNLKANSFIISINNGNVISHYTIHHFSIRNYIGIYHNSNIKIIRYDRSKYIKKLNTNYKSSNDCDRYIHKFVIDFISEHANIPINKSRCVNNFTNGKFPKKYNCDYSNTIFK